MEPWKIHANDTKSKSNPFRNLPKLCADVKTLTLKKHISAKNDHFQQFQTQVMVFNFVKGEKNIALKKGRANKGVWEVITNPKQYCEIAH